MLKLILAWVKGGKTNTAMIALVVCYLLNKYFHVVTNETEIATMLAVILGSVGQIHKLFKSDSVQKIITEIKKEKATETTEKKEG
jgi:predicted regulator of Ras-like GTPase activity (Roadblock/LC7/MglB family)